MSLRKIPATIEGIAKSLVNEFLNIGDREDLLQEAYLVYRKCIRKYDSSMGTKFSTYFRRCLRNRLIDIGRIKGEDLTLDLPLSYTEDGIEHLTTVIDNVANDKWSPEEYLLWEDIVTKAESYLSGIALQVFRLKLSAPNNLVLIKDGKDITLNEAIVRGYGITRKRMELIDRKVRRAVLLALDYTPDEVLEFLQK